MEATISNKLLTIPLADVELKGDLSLPKGAKGLIIFSHGSGSSRLSPRNRAVAHALQEKGFATLLFDLLTETEDEDYEKRFDIDLLAKRLEDTTRWIMHHPNVKGLSIGYFGASTGAASAMQAAARLPGIVKAIVSRGGRPDLAMDVAEMLQAPTLLIVGSLDEPVVSMNEGAYLRLACEKQLTIVKGATHLFPEPGKLEKVAELAAEWFEQYLRS